MFKTTLSAIALCVLSTVSYAQVAPVVSANVDVTVNCEKTASRFNGRIADGAPVERDAVYAACVAAESEAETVSVDQ